MNTLTLLWQRWQEVSPIATVGEVPIVIMIAISIAAFSIRPLWLRLRLIVTAVHEAGHAVVGIVLGRRVHGISLHADMSGVTVSSGRGRIRMIPVSFAGYPAPAVVGSGLLWAAATGHSSAALMILGLGFVLGVFFMRNLTGLLVTLGALAVVVPSVYFDVVQWRVLLTAGLGIFLNIGAVRAWLALASAHFSPGGDGGHGSDAWQLRRLTLLPVTFWLAAFAGSIGVCWWFSFRTLLQFLGT